MRLIARNRSNIHIWNVNDYLKQTNANIINQDSNNYVTLQRIFSKIYLAHLKEHQKAKYHQKNLDNIVTMSKSPAHSVADYFYLKGKSYSEPFLRAAFESIAKAYQISKLDNAGSLDLLGYKLFLGAQFSNLSEQLKYALRNNKIQFDNLIAVLQSLIKLEYVDYQIFNLLLLYTKREIEGRDHYEQLKNWEGDREFQIEKKNYYNPNELPDLQALRNCEEITTALNFVKHIHQEWTKEKAIKDSLERLNIKELNEFVQEITTTNKNFRKLVEGIFSVRKQYLKMVEFSKTDQILRNPNLNYELLDLQEKLLTLKLIDIKDIQNPKVIRDSPDLQIKRVEEIILQMLNIKRIDRVFSFIDKTPFEVSNKPEIIRPNKGKISVLLNYLSKIANIDRHVYHAADGKSLVNLKWEKTLIPQSPPNSQDELLPKEQLNVSRVYRRVYKETLQFFQKYSSQIDKIFIDANLTEKIELLDSYCRIGLHESAINQFIKFQQIILFEMTLKNLNQQKFTSLVHLANNIGLFNSQKEFHQLLTAKIQQQLNKQQLNQVAYNIRYTIDVLNYLIQNVKGKQELYKRQLSILESKAVYSTLKKEENQEIIEAFKILALQIPQKFGAHPIYVSFLRKSVFDEFKRNPFHAILRETLFKWADKERYLRTLQNYLLVGASKGIKNAAVFSRSDETSLDGEIRNGDLNSYIIRLQIRDGVKVNQLSINSLLNINYQSQKVFKLKSIDLLKEKFNQIFEDKQNQFDKIFQNIQDNIITVLNCYKKDLISEKIKIKLIYINKLRKNLQQNHTKQQEYSRKAQYILEILELEKLLKLLTPENILQLVYKPIETNIEINKQNSKQNRKGIHQDVQERIKVDVPNMKALLKQIKNSTPDLLDSLAIYMSKQTSQLPQYEQKQILNGQRQSMQNFSTELSNSKIDISHEILNMRYYNDKTYCEYQDWKDKLAQEYHMVELNYDTLSTQGKVMAFKFCGGYTNKITMMPLIKHKDRIEKANIQFKIFESTPKQPENNLLNEKFDSQEQIKQSQSQSQSIDITFSESKDTQDTTTEEKQIQKLNKDIGKQQYRQYLLNFLSYKYELKHFFTPHELSNYLFSFKFINILDKPSSQEPVITFERNPEEYFNHLERLNENCHLESPYARYIISKLGKTDSIRLLLQERKNLRVSLRILYQKGLINGTEYYQRINQFQDKIIQALKDLESKMLDNMNHQLLNGEFKMIDIKKQELVQFQNIINKQFIYSRFYDEDFIYANGDYSQALQLKKARAQNNFTKLYLLKKLAENQKFQTKDKELLAKWHEQIKISIDSFNPPKKYTNIQIKDLDWQDLQKLKLNYTFLNINQKMLVIDLILQLNQFLDETLIHNYEREVKAEILSAKYKIPSYLFDKTNSSGFKRLSIETEAAIIDEKSRLTESDIDRVEQFFKVNKVQGFLERNRYAVYCKNYRSNITRMNKEPIRMQLISEYSRHLQQEFYEEYDPNLVEQTKETQIEELWSEIFNQTYEKSSRILIQQITKKLIVRMEMITDNPPPLFGALLFKILTHPKIDPQTRESLLVAIEINNFDLKIDSADFLALSKMKGRKTRPSSETLKDFKNINVNVSKLLRQRAKSII